VVLAPPGGATTTTPRSHQTADKGAIGVRLVDAPVSAGKDPRALLYIVDHLAPGTVIHRRIEVSSTVPGRVQGLVYPAAAAITSGSFRGADGHTPNELSTWTAVAPGKFDLANDGRMTATVTVAVPRDASPGERYAVVWAETRSPAVKGGGVVDVSRVGIRLYLSVGPGGAPAADFAIESLAAQRSAAGVPAVVARVRNTGGRALDMGGTLSLKDGPGGLRAGPFRASLGTTLTLGASEAVTIALDARLPAGPWKAQLTLRSGLVEHTAGATITFPDSGTSAPVRTGFSWQPWMYVAVGLAILALVVACLLNARSRARRRRRAPTTA
jgi:hypothetical protein